jgi:hypothetical protein
MPIRPNYIELVGPVISRLNEYCPLLARGAGEDYSLNRW